MNATKERWQTPRTAFERFVTDRYVAACDKYTVIEEAEQVHPGEHFWLDHNNNGYLDSEDKSYAPVTTNNSGHDPNPNISYWAWLISDPNGIQRFRVFQLQNDKQWGAYNEVDVTPNHS